MPFEIKEKGNTYYVIDTATQKIKGSYDDEDSADDRKDDLEFKEHVRERLSRMPVTQMTAEEKAAEYDNLMAAKNAQKPPETDSKIPPKIDPPAHPPEVKRSRYWGDQGNDSN
jgi:hypothetical protein